MACMCLRAQSMGREGGADYRGPKWLGRASDADVHTYHSTVSVSVLTRPRHLKHRDTWEAKYRECNDTCAVGMPEAKQMHARATWPHKHNSSERDTSLFLATKPVHYTRATSLKVHVWINGV